VTPESASYGDFAESGFEREPYKTRSIEEVIQELAEIGYFEIGNRGETHLSAYATDWVENYRTGEQTQYAVHISGPAHLMNQLYRVLESRQILKNRVA
jgi:hypothetical protein